MKIRQLFLLLLLLGAVLAFMILDLGRFVSLAYLKESQTTFLALCDQRPLLVLQDTLPRFSFKAVMQRIQSVIAAIEPHDSVERYTALGVDVLQGHARIVNPWTVVVALNNGGTQRLTTRSIVIAAGAQPVVPALPGLAEVGYVTSDTLWDTFSQLDAVPRRYHDWKRG